MYSKIITLLQADEFMGVSHEVDLAKGHKEALHTVKETFKQIKRSYHGRKYKV
jgi:hypothetical protein